MVAADPYALAAALGLAVAPAGALVARRGWRARGAAVAAACGAIVGWAGGALAPHADRDALAVAAAVVAALAAVALPGLPLAALRRRSFGASYPRAAYAAAFASAPLPARLAGRRPSALLDAADRLRLESALTEVEAKTGAAIAVALVAHAVEHEGAAARAALFGGALGLAAAAAFAALPAGLLAATAVGVGLGRALARSARGRRLFVAEADLAAAAARAAADAFAHAGLAAAPGDRGLLLFAALFEARVCVLATRGLTGATGAEPALTALAAQGAAGLAKGEALAGLEGAARDAARLDVQGRRAADGAPAPRPHPVRVED